MKIAHTLSALSFALLLISCGENTTSSPITDVVSIQINESNISLYSTDTALALSSTVYYDDDSSASASADMAWSSSDTATMTTISTSIVPVKNGGDANVTIDYKNTFNDTQPVHIKELLSINYSDFNIRNVGNPQIVQLSGNFENDEKDILMKGYIAWDIDENATINDVNASAITITVTGENLHSIFLKGTLFSNTENAVDFNRTFY